MQVIIQSFEKFFGKCVNECKKSLQKCEPILKSASENVMKVQKSRLFFVKINDMIVGLLSIFYWSSDTGVAEVDFIAQIGRNNVPIEVKASENLQAKSLK